MSKPGLYTRYAAATDARITKVGRHTLVGATGAGVAAGLGHYGVAGLELTPQTVAIGGAVGVAGSVLADVVLLDEEEYDAALAYHHIKAMSTIDVRIGKRSEQSQLAHAAFMAAM